METNFNLSMILKTKMLELQNRNSSFSLRSFARRLNISSGALSDILQGKRKVSRKKALEIVDRLSLTPEELQKVFADYEVSNLQNEDSSLTPIEYLRLSSDQFESIADWVHFAILSLMKTKEFRSDSEWIAQRLGLTAERVDEALERLFRLGIVTTNIQTGALERKVSNLQTSEDILNLSIQRAHLDNLRIAEDALLNVGVEDRDYSLYTLALNKKNLPEIKKMIRDFQDELSRRFTSDDMDEVYRFSTQMFPLTKLERKK